MNKFRVFRVTDLCKNARRFRVNQKRAITLGLASIDIREPSGINQHFEIHRAQFSAHIIKTRKVKLSVIEASDIVFLSILPQKRGAESPARAEDYNFHLFRAPMPDPSFGKSKT